MTGRGVYIIDLSQFFTGVIVGALLALLLTRKPAPRPSGVKAYPLKVIPLEA